LEVRSWKLEVGRDEWDLGDLGEYDGCVTLWCKKETGMAITSAEPIQ
jgi:hypothetical protein